MKIQTPCRSNVSETGIDCELQKGWIPKIGRKKSFKFSLLNCYEIYKSNKEAEKKPYVSKEQFLKFLNDYFYRVYTRIVEDGFILILPYYMGRFYLQKSKRLGFVMDKDSEYWRKKRTANLHSFRKFYNVRWDKSLGYFKNRNLWKFIASKPSKHQLATTIFKNDRPVIEKPLIGHNHKETKWS